MKKLIPGTTIMVALGAGVSTPASAALMSNAKLDFDAGVVTVINPGTNYSTPVVYSGSYFGFDNNGNGIVDPYERTAIAQNAGLLLGTTQGATGSHSGAPNGSESPGIDKPWDYFFNTGMHYTVSPTKVLSATGNTATIDFSGWRVAWNGDSTVVNLSNYAWADNADGVADVTCSVDCGHGDTYTLDYSAVVQPFDPSGGPTSPYAFHLEGSISSVPVPAAIWLFGSGLLGLVGVGGKRGG